MPHCLRAIDGKHIVMQAPANSRSSFYNYKGTFSIVLLAVCDARYCFTLLDIGNYGRHSDGGVLINSAFGKAMEQGSFQVLNHCLVSDLQFLIFFVGNSAFPLKTYMLHPYPGKFLPENKQIFNYRPSSNTKYINFGIMSTKFRIFRRSIIANPDKVTKITKAACCLHNYLRICEMHNSSSSCFYCPPGYVDREDNEGNVIPGDWRSDGSSNALRTVQHVGSNNYSRSASELRDTMIDFMTTPEGAVPWQYTHVRSCGEQPVNLSL